MTALVKKPVITDKVVCQQDTPSGNGITRLRVKDIPSKGHVEVSVFKMDGTHCEVRSHKINHVQELDDLIMSLQKLRETYQ